MPVERPDPVPGPEEVLIRRRRSGREPAGRSSAQGRLSASAGASDIPGLEVSGTIAAIGAGVRQWKVDDAGVRARRRRRLRDDVRGAGAAVPAGAGRASTSWPRRRFPRRSSPSGPTCSIEAGCAPARRRSFTAGRAASARPRFNWPRHAARPCSRRPGRTRSVARARTSAPSRPSTTARPTSSRRCSELTGGKGVDLILDMVGGSYVGRNLEALATDGRLVQIGFMSGESTAPVDFRRIMARRLTITGRCSGRGRWRRRGRSRRRCEREVWPLLDRGVVKPVIHRVVSARPGRRRASADGVERARRQDRARDIDRAFVRWCSVERQGFMIERYSVRKAAVSRQLDGLLGQTVGPYELSPAWAAAAWAWSTRPGTRSSAARSR